MSLVKQSERTVRKACRKCGSTDLYWTTDTNTGKFVLVDANAATRATAKGGDVSEEHAHKCIKGEPTTVHDTTDDQTDDPKEDDVVTFTILPEAKPEPAPVVPVAPTTTDAPSGDVRAALEMLAGALAPKVDADSIREMVRAELGKVVFPTRTVVINERNETHDFGDEHTHKRLGDVIRALGAGEHVLMVGPAGTGKSTIAEQAATALNLPAYSLSLSPQTSTATVFGFMHAGGDYVRTLFREAYEHGGVFNFDEMDNGHPSILAAINGALANGHAAFPDGMVKRADTFRCVGSANTYGRGADRKYVGRQALDAATLDRFTFLTIDIDEALETALCESTGAGNGTVSKVLTFVRKIRANVESYSLPVVVSPRASVGMCRLIAAGFDWDEAVDARIRRGLSDADWAKLTTGVK